MFSLPSSLRANVRKTDVVIQAHRSEQEYDDCSRISICIFSLFSYFDSDDLDDNFSKNSKSNNRKKIDDDLDYQPAPGSPSYQAGKKDEEEDDDDEEDPLEQFMKANNNQAKKDLDAMGKKKDKKQEKYWSKELNLYVYVIFI